MHAIEKLCLQSAGLEPTLPEGILTTRPGQIFTWCLQNCPSSWQAFNYSGDKFGEISMNAGGIAKKKLLSEVG